MLIDDRVIDILREAKSLVVITGSGISAESGIPTFRGEDGLWNNYRAEELATPQAFHADPELVWQWYDWRRGIIAGSEPNPAHEVIAKMESSFDSFLLITQNVDGLHRRAGNTKLVEIHGNIWKVRCTEEGKEFFLDECPITTLPPRCDCGAMLRPAVVWFGEGLAAKDIETAQANLQKCDVLVTVGTSGVVYPVASFPMMAKNIGAKVIEINLDETPITAFADFTILGKAGDILPGLWRLLQIND